MPELPEVETIRRGLEKRIIGKKISDIEVLTPKIFIGEPGDVVDKEIEAIKRRAKVLQIDLSGDKNLLFHLKMTGQLIYRSKLKNQNSKIKTEEGNTIKGLEGSFAGGHPTQDWLAELPNKHTRIIFSFGDGAKLFYNDLRKFGWCRVATNSEVKELFAKEYGPEPFSKEFTPEYLKDRAKRVPNRKVKQFILDQSIIAGVGNIYTDEALFYARISPLRVVKDITDTEWKKLRDSIIKSLELGIKWGGASIDTYVNAEGEVGGAHLHTKVYKRTGDPCPDGCGGIVKKITVGGRGTHYCPQCQR